MASDYDRIREENLKEYGEGTRHLAFLGRLYSDRTHFLFELLQNAEDAQATKICFRLYRDRLEVWHDGRPFDENDVRGVCGVGETNKADDLTQIGKFGIGFKSVYAYTTRPEIHSGDEHFCIQDFVRPQAIPSREMENSWTTLFVFPFNHETILPNPDFEEIRKRLETLNARTLLFLRNIEAIEWDVEDGSKGIYLRGTKLCSIAHCVNLLGQIDGQEDEEEWLVFERPIESPNIDGSVRVEVAYQLAKEEKTDKKIIVRIEDSPLVGFFATEKETSLGFLIQGPYRTTMATDSSKRKND